jgi:molybdenum cofactor cytidylyltransferase
MKFGPVEVSAALGNVLGHSLRLSSGRTLRKGRVLDASDVADLAASGHHGPFVAQLDAEDVAEDQAAAIVAQCVAGPGLSVGNPAAGRADLRASQPGIAIINRQVITAINALGEELGIATVAPHARVVAGERVATVKVIPFAVARTKLADYVSVSRQGCPIAVRAFVPQRVGLVCTALPGDRPSAHEAMVGAVRARVRALGSSLVTVLCCPHRVADVAESVARLMVDGCSLILASASSATVDRSDVIPLALAQLGARLERFGMPTEPGNLLLLARLGTVPVIGVPGCARSSKRGGFDMVLERLAAGLTVTFLDLARAGVGGLFESQRAEDNSAPAVVNVVGSQPAVAALVLAAGCSTRMGSLNKLLAKLNDVALVARMVDEALASGVQEVFVVTGHQAAEVRAALSGRPVMFIHNPDHTEGIASSVRAGVATLGARFDAVVVCLGDMPRVRADHIDALLRAFQASSGQHVCVPVHRARRGNPVLWPRSYFGQLERLHGDLGARTIIASCDKVARVDIDDDGILFDVDTPEALQAALAISS